MGTNPSSQKKKKKVKKPKNIGNSFQVNISLITTQNKKKTQICLPQQIPNSLFKNQKKETLKKEKKERQLCPNSLLHRQYLYLSLHHCSPYLPESNHLAKPLVSVTLSLFVCTLVFCIVLSYTTRINKSTK